MIIRYRDIPGLKALEAPKRKAIVSKAWEAEEIHLSVHTVLFFLDQVFICILPLVVFGEIQSGNRIFWAIPLFSWFALILGLGNLYARNTFIKWRIEDILLRGKIDLLVEDVKNKVSISSVTIIFVALFFSFASLISFILAIKLESTVSASVGVFAAVAAAVCVWEVARSKAK